MKRETRVFLALCCENILTIREFVNEILNDNLKNCLNLVHNKPIIFKSQISIFEVESSVVVLQTGP